MVEVLKNIEEVYSKWERKAQPQLRPLRQPAEHNNLHHDRNYDLPKSRKYQPNKYISSNVQVPSTLGSFKSMPSRFSLPKNERHSKNFLGYACSKCAPTSQASLIDEVCKNLGLKSLFSVHQQNKNRNLFVRKFAHLNYVYNCKYFKYNPPTSDILLNKRVQEGITKAINQDSSDIDHMSRAKKCYEQLKSTISSSLIRFVAWLLIKVLSRLFKSVQVHEGQLEALKKTEKFSKPVVYLPLHRSHLDYILITLILYLNDIRAPLIAAGDNLRLPFIGKILSGLGGFFIKRKLDNASGKKDYTYRAILHSYVVESLKLGNSLEFFVEGGRSRTGKVCLPKAGLLSIVIDAYSEGDIEDAYLVPVAISFEKLVEGNFVAEQMGHKKKKETFFGALSNIWSVINKNFGNVRVDFGQPFILSEYLESIRRHLPSTPTSDGCTPPLTKASIAKSMSVLSLYGTDIAKEEHRQLINNIAQHIVYDAAQFYCLMNTNLVSFLLLTRHRQGTHLNLLVEDFKKLREDLTSRKKNVGFAGSDEDVVLYACDVLGKELVTVTNKEEGSKDLVVTPNIELPPVLELSYYSAPVVTTYFCQSVVAMSIISILNVDIESLKDCQSEVTLNRDELVETCLNLCNIMQFEHIFNPPCENLETVISEIIDDFITQELLHNDSDRADSAVTKRASALEACFSWESEEYGDMNWTSPLLTVNLSSESVEKLRFLQSILSPYLESYWVTSVQLYKLLQMEMEEDVFLKSAQKDIKTRLDQGLLLYNESIGLETIKNALKLLEVWGVVEQHREENIKLIYLVDEHKNSDKINSTVARIQTFRS